MGIGLSCRLGIESHVSVQYVDSLVEVATTLLKEQFSIIKECILGNGTIILGARCHGKRVHGIGLIASTQITVGKVIRGILREHIVRSARLTKI